MKHDIEPLDSHSIEIAATETRQSFMLEMPLFRPRNEIPLQLY